MIDGIPLTSPSASFPHQIVAANILYLLSSLRRERDADWVAIPGIALPVPGARPSAPIPDVMVLPKGGEQRTWKRDDALVAIEILSPGSVALDLRVKPRIYGAAAALRHFVVVAPERAHVVLYDRAAGWEPVAIEGLAATAALSALDAALPLAEVYRDVAFAKPKRRGR